MKSLAEHDQEMREGYHLSPYFSPPRRNGIECPDCDYELFDTNPNTTLTSNPPQKEIHCSKCSYAGYRIA